MTTVGADVSTPGRLRRRITAAVAVCPILVTLISPNAWAQDPAGSIAMRVGVRGIWVHDVPRPPDGEGDSWDSSLSSVLSLLGGSTGIYPDVVVCARPAQPGFTGRPSCTQKVCTDLQGDTTLGAESKECQRPLRLDLPTGDPRLILDVLEMNDVNGQPQVHRVIARNVLVADPTKCNEAQPCRFESSAGKGALVLSFTTETAGTFAAAPRPPATSPAPAASPVRCQPSPTWQPRDLSPELTGLHGPYASVDEALRRDPAGRLALRIALQDTTKNEYGFEIVRDSRQPTGAYYTTPPVAGTAPDSTGRGHVRPEDYDASFDKAFSGCDYATYFQIPVALIHTHPDTSVFNGSFTPDDFYQAIQMKQKFPMVFEKIVFIYTVDHQVRKFEPTADDSQFWSLSRWAGNAIPWVSPNWWTYENRVLTITTYP